MKNSKSPDAEFGVPDPDFQAPGAFGFVRDNPLGVVLCGFALGLTLGALAPVTDFERRKLGPLRDELVEHAQAAADEVVTSGKRVVEETVSAATESAAKHGQELVAQLQRDFGLSSQGEPTPKV